MDGAYKVLNLHIHVYIYTILITRQQKSGLRNTSYSST